MNASPVRPTLRIHATIAISVALAGVPLVTLAAPPPADAVSQLALPVPKDFAAAVEALERATGVQGEPVELGGLPVPAEEGRAFPVNGAIAERLLAANHAKLLQAGLYLFRLERSFGIAGEKDPLVLLRAADRSAVIRRVGTTGPKVGATTEKIVAWLDRLAKDEPFELTEIGVDYLVGRFVRAPKDPAAVARRCVELAPDLVAARASSLDILVEEIKSARTLYLIW